MIHRRIVSQLIIRGLTIRIILKQDAENWTLGDLLARVSRLVGRRMRMKLVGTGLHHAQGMILFHLWHADGVAQNKLARSLHITAPTASATLQRMERDGWIRRRRDIDDQRVVRVYLTAKAKALRVETRSSFKELDSELTSVLSEAERTIFMAALKKVHHHLSQKVNGRHKMEWKASRRRHGPEGEL